MGFNNYYYVMEAFQAKDMESALSKIKSYLENSLGVKLYQKYGVDYFKNSRNKGEGIRYFLPNDSSIRFNFTNNAITSVDIWNTKDKDPYISFETKGISVVQILPFVANELKNPQIGTFEVALVEPEKATVTTEAEIKEIPKKTGEMSSKSKKEEIQKLLKTQKDNTEIKKIMPNVSDIEINMIRKLLGMMKEIKVYEAGKNEINTNPEVEKLEPSFNKNKFADLDTVYKDIGKLVTLIKDGKAYSLLITGAPGTGKTHTVTDTLKGTDFIHEKGKINTPDLYKILYMNNGKTIVIDDISKVFKDGKDILLAALDNKPERSISYRVQSNKYFDSKGLTPEDIEAEVMEGKIPNKFDFNGKVIFITNIPRDKIDEAIISRSFNIDVNLKSQDMILRIRQIIDKIKPEVDKELKEELLNFMEANVDKMKGRLDLRSFDKAVTIIASGDPDWKRLVLNNV